MRRILLNSVQLNAVRLNGIGECQRVSHAGAPPVVPDVPDIPDIPEEPDVPSDPDVDENGYIIFADPEVKRVLLANGVGDGVGITKEAAAEVTSIGTWFKDNTSITSFEELKLFPNIKTLELNAFNNCGNLTNVGLVNIEVVKGSALNKAGLDYVILPSVTAISSSSLSSMPNVKGFFFGELTSSFSNFAARFCQKLEVVVCAAITPPSLGSSVFASSPFACMYVPDASVEAYKTATNWSAYASSILPISQLATDNPEFYAEIEEYL